MVEVVAIQKYRALYRHCIERDFARDERRPLFLIRRLHARGMYDFLVLRDDKTGKLLAYAGLIHAPNVDSVLLDYFAVEPSHRGEGVGSRFLWDVVCHYESAGGILIECETPALAKGEAEQATREKRIAFYLKNGAESTGAQWHFLGVGYDLLWVPLQKQSKNVDVRRDIANLYGLGAPHWMARLASIVLGGNA